MLTAYSSNLIRFTGGIRMLGVAIVASLLLWSTACSADEAAAPAAPAPAAPAAATQAQTYQPAAPAAAAPAAPAVAASAAQAAPDYVAAGKSATTAKPKAAKAAPVTETQKQQGTLVWGLGGGIGTINFRPFEGASRDHWGMKESLLWHAPAPVPDRGGADPSISIANGWDLAADLSKITFSIRQDVPFHKGWGNVTAHDVAFSFNDAVAPGATGAHGGFIGEYLDTMVVVDDYTVDFLVSGKLSPNWATELSNTWRGSIPIVSKKAFDELGADDFMVTAIGTGPFENETWSASEHIISRALPTHYREAAKVAEFKIVDLPEESTRVAAFRTGEVHISDMTNKFIREASESVKGRVVKLGPGQGQHLFFGGNFWSRVSKAKGAEGTSVFPRPGLTPDKDHPWIGDPDDDAAMENARKVRWALAMAIDRDLVNESVQDGLALPNFTYTGFNPGSPYFKEEYRIPYDVEGAKKLLAEAGYPNHLDGLKVRVWTPPNHGRGPYEVGQAAAQLWNQNLGIDIEYDVSVYSANRPLLISRSINFPFQHVRATDSAYEDYGRLTGTGLGGANRGIELHDDILEETYYKLATTFVLEERAQINQKYQDYYTHWMMSAPLIVVQKGVAVRPEVESWVPYMDTFANMNAPETAVLK